MEMKIDFLNYKAEFRILEIVHSNCNRLSVLCRLKLADHSSNDV